MNAREQFQEVLNTYEPFDDEEAEMLRGMMDFLAHEPGCYERSCVPGHMTASAWVVAKDLQAALLLHHAKLNKWLQPGGHADGDMNLGNVARKEVFEETGLDLSDYSGTLFDLDIHLIPARGDVAAHFHYDVRYLFLLDQALPLQRNHESLEVSWIPLAQIHALNNTPSIMRMVNKTIR